MIGKGLADYCGEIEQLSEFSLWLFNLKLCFGNLSKRKYSLQSINIINIVNIIKLDNCLKFGIGGSE